MTPTASFIAFSDIVKQFEYLLKFIHQEVFFRYLCTSVLQFRFKRKYRLYFKNKQLPSTYRKNDNELVFKQIKLFVNYYVSLENKVNVYQFVHVLCNSTDH